jgi:hypothetical protein
MMTLASKQREKVFYVSRDQEEVTMLLTYRVEIMRTKKAGKWTDFYFDREIARPFVQIWCSGQPMPVSDLRDVFRAIRIFNQAIHGEI